jgi:hypothetical protein
MFIDPNVQNPQTVQLTSSNLFHLEVTGLPSLCMSTDDMTVTISGGPLSINPVAVPGTICRYTNSQLFSNAGGGSGNFSYFWTSIPPGNPLWTSNLSDPVVSPDASTQYNLTVSDGFNTTSGSANLIVNQLPTAVISGGGSLCEDGSLAIIRIDLTGIPPWSFTYSNGLTSVTIDGQFTTPYFIMTNVPGVYTVPSINDLNCFGTTSGTASVLLFPVPDKPTITQSGDTLISNASMGNQWYRNLVLIPGATDQDYIPTENGDYYDIVTLNNCSSDSSNTISVLYTNADNGRLNSFQVFPNPAKNYLMIRSSSFFQENMKLTIFSTDGLLIREYQVKMSEGSTEYRIDTSKLSPGLYILMISGGDRRIIERVIVF